MACRFVLHAVRASKWWASMSLSAERIVFGVAAAACGLKVMVVVVLGWDMRLGCFVC